MSRLSRTDGLKGIRKADVTQEPASPKTPKLEKNNALKQNVVTAIRATVTFPATHDFTFVLANYIRDIELSLPPGGKAPKPAEIFRSFLDKYDSELSKMLNQHLTEWGRQ
jgi:hypothetical protein